MSANRRLPRLLAASATVLAAGLATLALAAPARAADGDVKVTISGLGNSVSIGRDSESFSVKAENKTENGLTNVRRYVVVQLGGLNADQVTVRRSGVPLQRSSPGPGEVRFEELFGFNLEAEGTRRDEVSASFNLQFSQGAPAGEATVTALVVHNGQLLGSDRDQIMVRGSGGQGPTSAPPTSLPPVTYTPPAADPSETSVVPLDANAQPDIFADSSGIPTILYISGGVLLVIGAGILWLLLRSPKEELAQPHAPGYVGYPVPDYDQPRPASLGYPSGPRHAATSPTTIMPAVRDENWSPPPSVDPWAKGAMTDPTREYPGPR